MLLGSSRLRVASHHLSSRTGWRGGGGYIDRFPSALLESRYGHHKYLQENQIYPRVSDRKP